MEQWEDKMAAAIASGMDAVRRGADWRLDPPEQDERTCFECAASELRTRLTGVITRHYVPEDKADALFTEAFLDECGDLIEVYGGPWKSCRNHGGV